MTIAAVDFYGEGVDERLHLVDFSKITPQVLETLIQTSLTSAHASLENLPTLGKPDAIEALKIIQNFDKLSRQVERYFGVLSHLNSVMSNDEIREVHHKILPQISDFYTKVGQTKNLYELYKVVKLHFEDLPSDKQTFAQKRAIDLALQSFELSGIHLDDDNQRKFADIQSELSSLSAKFSDNVLDATACFGLPLTQAQLQGITENGLALLRSAGNKYRQDHPDATMPTEYVATLDIPMYLAVMQYADDRQLRETLYHAYNTRASEHFCEPKFDNADVMTKILSLRQDKAKLLGFEDYTGVSLAPKMANSSAEVIEFLMNLAKNAKPFAMDDLEEMKALAHQYGIDNLEAWDVAYLAEKIRLAKFNLNSDEIRPYFPLLSVLNGLFGIVGEVFGVSFRAVEVPTWHADVQFFELCQNDEVIGGVYLDLYTRTGKRGGAWLSDFQGKYKDDDSECLPVGFIVCNFAPPIDNQPSQLSFDDVVTLFHEFGHGLHHLLTRVTVADVAGIHGVEWDAVELPSQFMENFVYHAEGVSRVSSHVQTGEPLPEHHLSALIRAKNFQSGLQTLRQLEFGLFDMQIHGAKIAGYQEILDILTQVRDEVSIIKPPATNRFANSFSHIFAGGYAAGYYSYKWAELLSADAFSRFEETGIFNADTGKMFVDNILATGGSRSAKDNFYGFMGRDAKIDALLRHSGFIN